MTAAGAFWFVVVSAFAATGTIAALLGASLVGSLIAAMAGEALAAAALITIGTAQLSGERAD